MLCKFYPLPIFHGPRGRAHSYITVGTFCYYKNFEWARGLPSFSVAPVLYRNNGGGGVFLITKVVDVPKKVLILPKEAPPSPIFETFMSVVPRGW